MKTCARKDLLSEIYSIHSLYVNPSDVGFAMIARPRLYILLLRKGHVKLAADLRETYDKVKVYFRSRVGSSNAAAAFIATASECLTAENDLRRRRGFEPASTPASDWTYLCLSCKPVSLMSFYFHSNNSITWLLFQICNSECRERLSDSEQKRLADFTALRHRKKGAVT